MNARLIVGLVGSALVLLAHAVGGLPAIAIYIARAIAVALVPLVVPIALKRAPGAGLLGGVAALAFLHTLLGVSGGLSGSPFHPLVYLLVAAAAALLSRRAAAATVAAAVLTEIVAGATGALPWSDLLVHIAFMAVFGALFAVLLRTEVDALRRAHRHALDESMAQVEQDAHDFRLTAPAHAHDSVVPDEALTADPAHRRWVGSVRAIRDALRDVMELARLCVDADSITLFAADKAGETLKLKACAPADVHGSTIDQPTAATEGAIGAVMRTRAAVRMTPKDPGRHLGHPAHRDARAFLGVPIVEGDELRGVLAANRTDPRPFEEVDEVRLGALAREVLRAMEAERIFYVMDRARDEQERFYEAFSLLNEALSVDAVAERLLQAALRVRNLGFGAVTTYDAETDTHTVLRVRADRPSTRDKLEGSHYRAREGGLVAMAIKNGHPLPYVPLAQQTGARPQIFGTGVDPDLRSVKVFPLVERGQPLGTLIVGSSDSGEELSREEERMLETIAQHAAITLANARMFVKVETLATTDPLTGLSNRRRFDELLNEAIARAERFSRKLTILMVDADHFKKVNDTYGHGVGDQVLQRIAGVLTAEARRTDVVGRYGGEEFIVLLDETDVPGALQVAERIRQRIADEVVRGDFGELSVTVSMGLATLPVHAAEKLELLACADQALYDAKESGRNRVQVHGKPRCIDPKGPAIATNEGRART